MTFSYRSRVEWMDTDAAGIYHNSTVVRFVESAEAALVREWGLGSVYFPRVPRVRYEVDFLAPLYFGQEVVTELTVARVGSSSMRFDFTVRGAAFDGRDAVVAARGSYVVVHIDRSTGQACAWPPEWAERFGGQLASVREGLSPNSAR